MSMQMKDSHCVRLMESPTKTTLFPLSHSNTARALNRGKSHPRGFHRHLRYSVSFRPLARQLNPLSANGHWELLYRGYLSSGTQMPSNTLQDSRLSPANSATTRPRPRYRKTYRYSAQESTSATEAMKKAKAMRSNDGPDGAAHQLRCEAPGVDTRGLPTPPLAVSRADVLRLKLPLTISPSPPPAPDLPFQSSPVAKSASSLQTNPRQTLSDQKWLRNLQARFLSIQALSLR
uniref:Uncharacterized protein n=1 Tax=Arundo donax TaxID=35708 RepID=A0A0A9I312_ARUDO